MPPGNLRLKPQPRLIERVTAEACVAIAHRIQSDLQAQGDEPGAGVAQEIAEAIHQELLGGLSTPLSARP